MFSTPSNLSILSDNELNKLNEDEDEDQQHQQPMSSSSSKSKLHRNSSFATTFLSDTLEYCEAAHVPREKLYDDYVAQCQLRGVTPLNSASFGKAIRSVFPKVSTRRLGQRGHSKYHYYGVKEKNDDNPMLAIKPPTKKSRQSLGNLPATQSKRKSGGNSQGGMMAQVAPVFREPPSDEFVREMLHFPIVDAAKVAHDVDGALLKVFLDSYREHCEVLLKLGLQGRFDQFSQQLLDFWRQFFASGDFVIIAHSHGVARLLAEWDALVYQAMLTVFLPDILGPGDQALLNELRDFTKHLPAIIVDAFANQPSPVYAEKARVASDFSKIVKQYHQLNNLALGCGQVTSQHELVAQMVSVWDQLNFGNITAQALYICPNAQEALTISKAAVRQKMVEQSHVSQWAEWIYTMTEQFLPHEHTTFEEYMYIAQQFVIRWSYVSSLILREICDKNKDIFGHFHVVRMFCDEYVKYLVDCKLDERRRHFDALMAEQWQNQHHVQHVGFEASFSSNAHFE